MAFNEFLETFRQKLGAQRVQDRVRTHLEHYFDFEGASDAPSRVKVALDYVFGSERKNLDSYEPDQNQTRDFIDYLIFAIQAENKKNREQEEENKKKKEELSQDRCLALTKLLDYNENPGTPYFSDIKPPVFAFQLALRVREPSLIDQSDVGICGENSLMIYFAKNTPSAFAGYGISLMRNGWGNFHGLMVKPSPEIVESFIPEFLREKYNALRESSIRSSYTDYLERKASKDETLPSKMLAAKKMAAADFVIMGSLTMGFFGSIKEGSWPDDVCERLSKAGLQNVENKVNPFSEPNKQNLTDACTAVKAGKLVMLCVWPELVVELRSYKLFLAKNLLLAGKPESVESGYYLQRGSGKKWEEALKGEGGLDLTSTVRASAKKGDLKSRHWILVTHLVEAEGKVTIKLYSWQHPVQGTLLLETFMTHYQGYVAADPPATTRG